jgi:hypothetical protein
MKEDTTFQVKNKLVIMAIEKINHEILQTILQLIEILHEIEDVDTLGNTISIKAKIVNKIDHLLDDL